MPTVVAQVELDEQAGLMLLAADPQGRVRGMSPGDPIRLAFRRLSEEVGLAEIASGGLPLPDDDRADAGADDAGG